MHVRVLNLEARPLQAVHVINHAALEKIRAHRINDDLDAVLPDDFVIGLLVVKRHSVLHTGAATGFHINTQRLAVGILVFTQCLDLLGCILCQRNH